MYMLGLMPCLYLYNLLCAIAIHQQEYFKVFCAWAWKWKVEWGMNLMFKVFYAWAWKGKVEWGMACWN
jgi:hypothetical protein